jgi:sRNA-binding carbon storage regulator CsrA
MVVFWRKVDQWIQIGRTMFVGPTDIDKVGVRLLAKGRMIGGAEDGATFEKVAEVGKGGEMRLGPHVIVTVIEGRGDAVRLGVHAPPSLRVNCKELVDEIRTERGDSE